jgi:hypothetical protein
MEKKKKMGDPVSTVVIYWLAASTLVGSAWNAFQIWERCKTELRPPEQKEEWDGNARLMLENVHEAAINDQRLDIAIGMLENVEDVVTREDSHGRKMVYWPKEQLTKIFRRVLDNEVHQRDHRDHHRDHRGHDPHADTLESDSSFDSVTVSTSD